MEHSSHGLDNTDAQEVVKSDVKPARQQFISVCLLSGNKLQEDVGLHMRQKEHVTPDVNNYDETDEIL